MAIWRETRAIVKVLCMVMTLALGMFSPAAATAVPHCVSSAQMDMHLHAGIDGNTGDHRMNHSAQTCCLAACNLQSAVTPQQTSNEREAEVVDMLFPALSERLTNRPVPPAFEPPRAVA